MSSRIDRIMASKPKITKKSGKKEPPISKTAAPKRSANRSSTQSAASKNKSVTPQTLPTLQTLPDWLNKARNRQLNTSA